MPRKQVKTIEFDELSQKYSDAQISYQTLGSHAEDITKLEKRVEEISAELPKYSEDHISIVAELLPDDQVEQLKQKREALLNELQSIRNNDLYKKRDEFKNAEEDLKSYMEIAETSPDFIKEVYKEIVKSSKHNIRTYTDAKKYPQEALELLAKLEEKAKSDSDLKIALAIDADKKTISVIKEAQKLGRRNEMGKKDAKGKVMDDWSTDAITAATRRLDKKATTLKNYITNNASELGLASVDFSDPTSPLFVLQSFLDPSNLDATLENTKQVLSEKLTDYDRKISTFTKISEYANEDLTKSVPHSKPQKTHNNKLVAFIARLGSKIFNGFKNWFFEDSEPKKESTTKVVNTVSDWRDSIHTPLGMAKKDEKLKEYTARAKRELDEGER